MEEKRKENGKNNIRWIKIERCHKRKRREKKGNKKLAVKLQNPCQGSLCLEQSTPSHHSHHGEAMQWSVLLKILFFMFFCAMLVHSGDNPASGTRLTLTLSLPMTHMGDSP